MRRVITRWVIAVLAAASAALGFVALYHHFNPSLIARMERITANFPKDAVIIGWIDKNTILVYADSRTGQGYCTVDVQTGHTTTLTSVNTRIQNIERTECAGGSLNPYGSLSPDRRWLLVDGFDKQESKFIAVPLPGGKAIVWPRENVWSQCYEAIWLPDGSGFIEPFPGGKTPRLRRYRLNRPGVFEDIPSNSRHRPETVGDIAATIAVTSRVMPISRLGIFIYDSNDLRAPRRMTMLRSSAPDTSFVVDIDTRRGLILYRVDRQGTLPYALRALRIRFPSLPLRDPPTVIEVWVTNLQGSTSQMLGRYPLSMSDPIMIGFLPDGRAGFRYRGALFAVPLPSSVARGG